jgi:hypothetical protein
VRFRLHSKTVAVAASVLALGTVGLTALTSGTSGAAGLRAEAANGSGYWLAGTDGGVFAFGTAHFYGSLAGKHLAAPISGIVPTPDDKGYWLTGRDGAVYPFGDATSMGSMAGKALAAPVVGIAATHPAAGTGTGPRGPAGAPGPPGIPGPTGPVGQPNFAYIFNQSAQSVAIDDSITFDSNTAVEGFAHIAGEPTITVLNTGVYRIDTSVSSDEPSQITLFVNNAPVGGSTYGSAAGTQQNDGHIIIGMIQGDIVTLRNHSAASALTLPLLAGGTQTVVNASITIQQIATIPP